MSGFLTDQDANRISQDFKHGKAFRIGRFCNIEKDVIVGENISIGDYTKIMSDVRIGNNVILMDYVKLMPGTIIGDNCRLDDYVNTSGYCEIGNNVRIKRCTMIGQATRIEDDVWIGTNAVITDGVKVGRGAVIAAGAVVTTDVPPNTVAAGVPAQVIRKIEAGDIKTIMAQQLCSPVKWYESMKKFIEKNVEIYVEVGPGRVLSGILKKILPQEDAAQIYNVSNMKQLERFLKEVT